MPGVAKHTFHNLDTQEHRVLYNPRPWTPTTIQWLWGRHLNTWSRNGIQANQPPTYALPAIRDHPSHPGRSADAQAHVAPYINDAPTNKP